MSGARPTYDIGWVGTGAMGAAMCGHVLGAGHRVTVHNRTKERATALLARGAVWAESVTELAAASDGVVTVVGYPSDVREVILGPRVCCGRAGPARSWWT